MSNLTTYNTKNINCIPMGVPNVVPIENDVYHISYNNYNRHYYGCDTTALFIKETTQFLILNGNHTSNYEKCDTLQECLDYFYSNVKIANVHSEHGTVFGKTDYGFDYIKGGY